MITDDTGNATIDQLKIDKQLQQQGLERQMITNPLSDQENSYKLKEHDEVIVLAQNENILKKVN